ncbi:MAG: serine/threonine protein kinase, partial [Microbacterium sp.]
VERPERRKPRPRTGMAGLVRDEDTEFTAPEQPRTVLPWVIGAAIAAVIAVAALLTALLATGVL